MRVLLTFLALVLAHLSLAVLVKTLKVDGADGATITIEGPATVTFLTQSGDKITTIKSLASVGVEGQEVTVTLDPELPAKYEAVRQLIKKVKVEVLLRIQKDNSDVNRTETIIFDDPSAIASIRKAENQDKFRFAIAPGLGYAVLTGGSASGAGKNDFLPAVTAYIHFPYGEDFSRRILGKLQDRSTRLCTTVGTPVQGARAYVLGQSIMWGDNRFTLTTGLSFRNTATGNQASRWRSGWFFGVSYSIGG